MCGQIKDVEISSPVLTTISPSLAIIDGGQLQNYLQFFTKGGRYRKLLQNLSLRFHKP
jgi:hypothetical protein